MNWTNFLIVGCGGFLGAGGRYACSTLINRAANHPFPFGTLIVNIFGAFLIGLISELFAVYAPDKKRLLLFFTTGITGGFTTFSTFSLETLQLFEGGKAGLGMLNILLSLICCLAGVFLGKLLVWQIVLS